MTIAIIVWSWIVPLDDPLLLGTGVVVGVAGEKGALVVVSAPMITCTCGALEMGCGRSEPFETTTL